MIISTPPRLAWCVYGKPYSARILADGRVLETRRAGHTFTKCVTETCGIHPRIWPSEKACRAEISAAADPTAALNEIYLETLTSLCLMKGAHYKAVEIPNYAALEASLYKREYTTCRANPMDPNSLDLLLDALPPHLRSTCRAVGGASEPRFVPLEHRHDTDLILNPRGRWSPIYWAGRSGALMLLDGVLVPIPRGPPLIVRKYAPAPAH